MAHLKDPSQPSLSDSYNIPLYHRLLGDTFVTHASSRSYFILHGTSQKKHERPLAAPLEEAYPGIRLQEELPAFPSLTFAEHEVLLREEIMIDV